MDEDHARETDRIPPLYKMQTDLAVLLTEFRTYKESTERKLDGLGVQLKEAEARYSTKEEVERLRTEIADVKKSLGWVVKTVLTGVIVAVLSLVMVKTGLPTTH